MPKERIFNPVQAQRKADKAKAIKKGKADLQARRNEKLAQRNPDRIQKQIDDLKAIKAGGGKLTQVEEQSLEALEKDLKAVKKAREALGDKAPTFASSHGPHRDGGGGVLGKRRRDGEDDATSSDGDVPEDVKSIPMPRDTPPPIPKDVLDAWYAKRRAKRGANANANAGRTGDAGTDANLEPLGENRLAGRKAEPVPPVQAKVVYEAKPAVRDLKKEAVSAFVPTVVRMKLDKGRGHGGRVESQEPEQSEDGDHVRASGPDTALLAPDGMNAERDQDQFQHRSRRVTMMEVKDDDD